MENTHYRKDMIMGIALGISFVICMLFYWVMYNIPIDMNGWMISMICNNNIAIYVGGLIIFWGFFGVLFLFLDKMIKSSINFNQLTNRKEQIIVVGIIGCGLFLFTRWGLVTQMEEGPIIEMMNEIPILLNCSLCVMTSAIVISYIVSDKDISKAIYVTFAIYAMLITFLQIYINPFAGSANAYGAFTMALWDNTSVTETIFNVYKGVPYDISTTGLYGHYSLFLGTFLKLVGCSPRRVVFLLAACGVLSQAAVNYVITVFSPKKWIGTILITASVVRTTYIYYPISPIRLFMPLLFCVFFVYQDKKGISVLNKKSVLVGNTLCILALLWNIESAVACILTFQLYMFIEIMQKRDKTIKNITISILSIIISIVIEIGLAFSLIDFYNLIHGGNAISLGEFIYPFNVSSFTLEFLRKNPIVGNHAWEYILFIFLIAVTWGMYDIVYAHKTNMSKSVICIGLLGIVLFSYYMNEALWGSMEIVHQLAFVSIATLVHASKEFEDKKKSSYTCIKAIKKGFIILLIISSSIVATQAFTDPVRINARYSRGVYSFEKYNSDIDHLAQCLDSSVLGVGQGISMIYYSLGWDNYIKMRDTSSWDIDPTGESLEKALVIICQNDSFLISDTARDEVILREILQRDSNYKRTNDYYVDGMKYILYTR